MVSKLHQSSAWSSLQQWEGQVLGYLSFWSGVAEITTFQGGVAPKVNLALVLAVLEAEVLHLWGDFISQLKL